MKLARFGLTIAALAAVLFAPIAALAQTYPTQTPTYTPTAVLAPQTISGPGIVTMNSQGLGTVVANITGSGTGLSGVFQVSNDTGATWTTVGVLPATSSSAVKTIIANGGYRINAAGFNRVRFNATALTGSLAVGFSGTPGQALATVGFGRRSTYSASIAALAPAAAATDLFALTGSATKTVQVQRLSCAGISTAAATAALSLVKRSTANTGGTSTAPAGVPLDSFSPAASAVVAAYTANPTVGTAVGSLRAGRLTTVTAASSAFQEQPFAWEFGDAPTEPITLRGVGEVLAVSGQGGTFTSGAALDCNVTWTEE